MIIDHNHHINDYISTKNWLFMTCNQNQIKSQEYIHKNFQHLVIAWASDFVLPSVSVGVGETIGEEEGTG